MNAIIEFKGSRAYIDFGSSDISGEYKTSPNGKCFVLSDTLFSKNSDSEYAILFTRSEILCKKKLSADFDTEAIAVFDDGSFILLTETHISVIGPDGKQITKKSIPEQDYTWKTKDFFACVGTNSKDSTELFIFPYETKKEIKVTIPDIEHGETELLACNAQVGFTGDKFVFIYEDNTYATAFTTAGQCVDPRQEEIDRILEAIRIKKLNNRIERAKGQYAYWSNRLVSPPEHKKSPEDIEKARSETARWVAELNSLGIATTMPQPEEKKPEEKKPGLFAKLFGRK